MIKRLTTHDPDFTQQIAALLAYENAQDEGIEQTVAEIASKHGLHPTLVNEWKRQLADGASSVFEKGTGKAEKDGEALVGELYRQIGQQKVELDFLARKLGR